MNNIFILTLISALVISCGKNNKNEKDTPAGPTLEALTVSRITGTSWCFIDNMSKDFQVVTRMRFNGKGTFRDGSKAILDYLRVTPGLKTQVHLDNKGYEWLIKKADDDFLWSDRFTVELIDDQYIILRLENYRQQSLIFEEILKNHSQVKVSRDSFSPVFAISVKNRNFLSNDSERIGYPCDSFSSSFESNEPARPMVEFNLFLHQKIWTSRHEFSGDQPKFKFEKAMLIEFPVEILSTSSNETLAGTSWCSWYQQSDKYTQLKLLTMGHKKFVEQTYLAYLFEGINNKKDLIKKLEKMASGFSIYESYESISIGDGLIKGSYVRELNDSKFTVESLYFVLKDKNGVEFLAKGSPYHPQNSRFLFSNLYFNCSDRRPLELHDDFNDYLSTIIDFQHSVHGTFAKE